MTAILASRRVETCIAGCGDGDRSVGLEVVLLLDCGSAAKRDYSVQLHTLLRLVTGNLNTRAPQDEVLEALYAS